MAPGPVSHPHEGDCRLLCPCDFVCVDECVFVLGWGVFAPFCALNQSTVRMVAV